MTKTFTLDLLVETLEQLWVGTEGIQPNHTLEDLGMDDLDIVELEIGIEDERGYEVNDLNLRPEDTLQQVIDKVNEAYK